MDRFIIQCSQGWRVGPQGVDDMAMEMGNIELMVKLQVFTHIHDQRAVHKQFTPDTQ